MFFVPAKKRKKEKKSLIEKQNKDYIRIESWRLDFFSRWGTNFFLRIKSLKNYYFLTKRDNGITKYKIDSIFF